MIKMSYVLENNMWFIVIAFLWMLPWKGVALWKAAREKHTRWFIALLILNTFAILEILYLFVFSKRMHSQASVAANGGESIW